MKFLLALRIATMKRLKPLYFCLASVLVLGSPTVFATDPTPSLDWNQFRGPHANPVGENDALAEIWSVDRNVEWSQAIPGRGWSSPIITGGKVFLTSVTTDGESKAPQTGTDYSNEYVAELTKQGLSQEEVMKRVMERDFELPEEVNLHYTLHCLELETGSELWNREIYHGKPPGGRHRKNSFVSETPVTDGTHIYVFVSNLGLWAFDLDGKKQWETPIDAKPIYMEFGTGSSPALVDDRIITLNDNEEAAYLAAYRTVDGKQLWSVPRTAPDSLPPGSPKSSWTTPFIWRNAERTEIITIGPGVARSYDIDGKPLWHLHGVSSAPASSSFAVDGLLLLNCGKGKPIMAIRPGASGDISLKPGEDSNEFVAWSSRGAGTYIPTPVAYEGGLYVLQDNGIFQRLDLATGESSYKKRVSSKGANFSASPWAYRGMVFCLSEQGDTYVIEAGTEFKLVRQNPLDDFSMSTPAIVGDRILIRTESHLYSIRSLN